MRHAVRLRRGRWHAGNPRGQRQRRGRRNLATAGVQKWSLVNGHVAHALRSAKRPEYRRAVRRPELSGLTQPRDGRLPQHHRSSQSRRHGDIYAVTSTISANGDQGADPNKLVKVTDVLNATTLPTGDGRPRLARLPRPFRDASLRAGRRSVSWASLSRPRTTMNTKTADLTTRTSCM